MKVFMDQRHTHTQGFVEVPPLPPPPPLVTLHYGLLKQTILQVTHVQ